MKRLTRKESRAITRTRLLEAGVQLFRRDGYAATSVERIAEEAGFSKGAVYSNFESKEAIFLAVLNHQGQEGLDPLFAAIDATPHPSEVVKLLITWANERSHSGIWSLTILEHARLAGPDAPSLMRQREILLSHWRQLGDRVATRIPGMEGEGETLGALLHEIAYAPALTFMERPMAGDLMRLALSPWLQNDVSAQSSTEGGSARCLAMSFPHD